MFDVFGHPWGIILIAFLVFIVAILAPPLRSRWQLWLVPPALILAAFALDYFIQTDREKIYALLQSASVAVKEAKPDSISPLLTDDYTDSLHINKASALRSCRAAFSKPLVDQAITRIVRVEIAPDGVSAKISFSSRLVFNTQSIFAQHYKSIAFFEFEAALRKSPDAKWRIASVEVLRMDTRPVSWRAML